MLIRLTPAIKSTPNDENITIISRWGGEEFLLLGKCVDGEVPKNFLDELRVEINSKSFWTSKGRGRMTVTIGAGKYKVGQDYKEWINFVDKQLYVGKCTGKNKVVC